MCEVRAGAIFGHRATMRLLVPVLFLCASMAHAQAPFIYHTPRAQYLFPEEADPAYVLFADAPVHSEASMTAPVVLKPRAGEEVAVLDVSQDTLELLGVMSHWYRVALRGTEGWTWGGNLAQRSFGSHADASVKFFGGIDHVTRSDTGRFDFSYRIVAVKNGRELDRIVLSSFAWSFEEVRNNGSLGLRNVDDVITLSVPCVGGCGCTTGEVVVFWSGDRFHHAADLMGTPDGEYSESVTFLYPCHMQGEAGAIVRVTSTYEESEQQEGEDEVIEPVLMRILRREYLRWDGKAFGAEWQVDGGAAVRGGRGGVSSFVQAGGMRP